MLIVTQKQFRALADERKRSFDACAVKHLREHHPDWCGERKDAALLLHVTAAIAFAKANGVTQEENVLWLIDLQLQPGFTAPLSGYLHHRLTQPGFDESTRMRNFATALTERRRLILISLDTDLEALEFADG